MQLDRLRRPCCECWESARLRPFRRALRATIREVETAAALSAALCTDVCPISQRGGVHTLPLLFPAAAPGAAPFFPKQLGRDSRWEFPSSLKMVWRAPPPPGAQQRNVRELVGGAVMRVPPSLCVPGRAGRRSGVVCSG